MFRPPVPSTMSAARVAQQGAPGQPPKPPKHPWLKSALSWYTEQWKWSMVKGAAFFLGSFALAHIIDSEIKAANEIA